METLFFLFDALVITMLVFSSIRNDKHGPNEPSTGLFGYPILRVGSATAVAQAAEQAAASAEAITTALTPPSSTDTPKPKLRQRTRKKVS